jgi:ABC-type uncharacterized transport system substrate-binding protein
VRKRVVRLALSTLLLTLSFRAEAQQPEKVFRIGVLVAPSASYISYRVGAFRQRLSELGYVEGKNVVTDFRYAEGKVDRLPALAAELVRLEVNAIVTAEPSVTRPAKEATAVIPIVMTNDSDPVGAGFVDSLARPGGNVTGLTGLARELSGTRLELLKEIFPKLSRVAIVEMSDIPGNGQAVKDTEIAAAAMKIQTQYGDEDPDPVYRYSHSE